MHESRYGVLDCLSGERLIHWHLIYRVPFPAIRCASRLMAFWAEEALKTANRLQSLAKQNAL